MVVVPTYTHLSRKVLKRNPTPGTGPTSVLGKTVHIIHRMNSSKEKSKNRD